MDAQVAEVIALNPAPSTVDAVPEAAPVAADQPSEPKKPAAKAFETLDAILAAINEQDEQLRTMKTQIGEMLTANAALKKGVKLVVQNAEKNNDMEQELAQVRKKLAMMKTFLNG